MAQTMIQLTHETEEFVLKRRKQYELKGSKMTKADVVFEMTNKYPELVEKYNNLLKYKKFVEHVYSHKNELNIETDLPLEEWIECKICKKRFNKIVEDDKDE